MKVLLLNSKIAGLFFLIIIIRCGCLYGQKTNINYCFIGHFGNEKYKIYYQDSCIKQINFREYKNKISLIVPRKFRIVCSDLKINPPAQNEEFGLRILRKRNLFAPYRDTNLQVIYSSRNYLFFKLNKRQDTVSYLWEDEIPGFQ